MSSITEIKQLELKQIKKMKKDELVNYILSLYVDIDLNTEINKAQTELMNIKHEKLNKQIEEYKKSDIHLNKCIDAIRDQYLYKKYMLEHYDSLATDNLSFEDWKETL